MELIEKILLAVIVILAAAAMVLSLSPGSQITASSIAESEILFFTMQSFGENFTNYLYIYNESSDNYPITYKIYRYKNDGLIEAKSPLSTKKIYYLQNDTIMCIKFLGNENCASVKAESTLKNYILSMRNRFFDNNAITESKRISEEAIKKNYLFISPNITKTVYNGKACTIGSYIYDYSNLSLSDMSYFGMSSGMPLYFEGSFCVYPNSGIVHWSYFNYTYNGMFREWSRSLVTLDAAYTVPITTPSLSNTSILSELTNEQDYYGDLANCYLKSNKEESDKCIAYVALELRSVALCDYAGSRKDRCLLSLMPLLLDVSVCSKVQELQYRDDCYIELAGGYKNSSYCNQLLNSSKVDFCMNVSGSK